MIRSTDEPALAQLVQIGLQEEGLYEGELDGIYGPATEAAYQSFSRFKRYSAIADCQDALSESQTADLVVFLRVWTNHRPAYLVVAATAKIPAELVAAVHWRESNGNFETYLHNGDPLGSPTIHEPKGIFFKDWEPAAVDALTREKEAYALSGIEEGTENIEALCVFAEAFNGEGYADRGVPDPYVLAGTTGYKAGKFTADDVYDPDAVDEQVGVLALLRAILPPPPSPNQAMAQIHAGGVSA